MHDPYDDEVPLDKVTFSKFVGGTVHGSIHIRERIVNEQTFRGTVEALEHVDGELRIVMVDVGQHAPRRYQMTARSECRWLNGSTLVIESPGYGLTLKRIMFTTPMEQKQ